MTLFSAVVLLVVSIEGLLSERVCFLNESVLRVVEVVEGILVVVFCIKYLFLDDARILVVDINAFFLGGSLFVFCCRSSSQQFLRAS